MIDEPTLNRLLYIAAKIERESGFEFYRAQLANTESFIDDSKIIYPQVSFYNQENKRVAKLLGYLSEYLLELTHEQQYILKEGLKVWQVRFSPRLNETIIADKFELDYFLQMLKILNLDLKTTITYPDSEIKSDANIGLISQAGEKTKSRKLNRVAVKIVLQDRIKNYRTVNRLLFILSVYWQSLINT